MPKIKTFAVELKIFHTSNELDLLDNQVNAFIEENNVEKVISVSDTTTATGEGTAGIIRVLAYEYVTFSGR
jgi:hypothetical protein